MLLAYPVRKLGILCTMNLAWRWFLLGVCHAFWHMIKSAPADNITGKSNIVWGRSSWFPWTFPNPGWVLGSSLWTRDTVTYLLTCSKECQGSFICREGDCLIFCGYKRATQSMESIVPTSWDSYKKLSRPNAQENWRKRSCFIRTIIHYLTHAKVWHFKGWRNGSIAIPIELWHFKCWRIDR